MQKIFILVFLSIADEEVEVVGGGDKDNRVSVFQRYVNMSIRQNLNTGMGDLRWIILVMQILRGSGLRGTHLLGEDISISGARRVLHYGLCVFSDSSLDLSPKLITLH